MPCASPWLGKGHRLAKRPTPSTEVAASRPSEPKADDQTENGLREALDKSIGPLVPQQQRTEIVGRVYTLLVREHFSGPLPHPKHLREYDDILPGAADRIISMTERQLAHAAQTDSKIIADDAADRRLGMIFGFAAFMASIAAACFCAAINQPVVAGAFLAATVIGAVTVFVRGRFGSKSE